MLPTPGIAVDVALLHSHVGLLQHGLRTELHGRVRHLRYASAHSVDLCAAPARPRSLEVLHGEGLRIVILSHAAGEVDCGWAPVELVPIRLLLLIIVMLLRFMRAATGASM